MIEKMVRLGLIKPQKTAGREDAQAEHDASFRIGAQSQSPPRARVSLPPH